MSQIIASTYELIGQIGAGGGGNVYLANHLRLGKRVVLKADKRKVTTRPELLRREVDVLKELRHQYIPQVYDFFVEDDTVFTVMDFIDGESLDRFLKRGESFSQPQVIKWARQILEALSYLHSPTHGDMQRGYVHSDIKPANIMLRPSGDICLIDFNISLAIGEENIVGGSPGYASPEHYGLDYSFSSRTATIDDGTDILDDRTWTLVRNESSLSSKSSSKKIVVPDARSDIYSLGATLYHLLTGKKPARNATEVEPLSDKEFSPLIVKIINKAMNPNPDLRYQTANEMLEAFKRLWRDDPRVKRQRRRAIVASTLFGAMLMVGGLMTFVGLRQMERIQTAQVLANDSASALSRGDVDSALDYALRALVDDPGVFDIPYSAEVQFALTNALGVYDLSDSFKPYATINLPKEPFRILKSSDETKLIAGYAYEIAIYDIESGKLLKTLPTLESALCEIEFLSDSVILYAGADGLTAYDIPADKILWQADPATAIAISGDKSIAATIYRTDEMINFYDTSTGALISFRELDDKHLNIPENDKFTDTQRDVFELNDDGSMCAVSLNGGYLGLLDIYNKFNDLIIYEASDYSIFDGNFIVDSFAYSAAGNSGSLFGVVNYKTDKYVGDINGNAIFSVTLHDDEIYISQNDTIVKVDADTFAQTEIAYTENKNITAFDISDKYIVSATNDGFSIFYRGAGLLQTESRDVKPDFVLITDTYAALADRNSSVIEMLKISDYGDSNLLEYDPRIEHSEARITADGSSVLLFSINSLTILNADGTEKLSVNIPDSGKIYDQQYRRESDCLEVTYYNGKVVSYSASTGEIISETEITPPDDSLNEEFETDYLIIKSPLHGTPTVYSKETGKQIAELKSEDYLTYITEVGEYIIAQYISTDGKTYGVLMNQNCETIAEMPYLCDVLDDTLIYDFPNGSIKTSPIYSLAELKEMAKNYRN